MSANEKNISLPAELQQWVDTAVERLKAPERQEIAHAELTDHAFSLYQELRVTLAEPEATAETLHRLGDAAVVAAQYADVEKKPYKGLAKKCSIAAAAFYVLALAAAAWAASRYMAPVDSAFAQTSGRLYGNLLGNIVVLVITALLAAIALTVAAVQLGKAERAEQEGDGI